MKIAFLLGVFIAFFSPGFSDDMSMDQALLFIVDPINGIELETMDCQGAPLLLRVSEALPGCEPYPACSYGLTYNVTTNELNKKISAFLDQDMAEGCALFLELTPPTGARTLGAQPLSTIPIDLIIELSQTAGSGLPMTYIFYASTRAGVIPPTGRIVTLTLIDG